MDWCLRMHINSSNFKYKSNKERSRLVQYKAMQCNTIQHIYITIKSQSRNGTWKRMVLKSASPALSTNVIFRNYMAIILIFS